MTALRAYLLGKESSITAYSFFKGILKFMLFSGTLIVFIILQETIKLFLWNHEKRLKLTLKFVPKLCQLGLTILNIDVIKKNLSVPKGKLIVANHLSYVDILVLFSTYPSLFITSREIKETFLLGRITELAGCFFVERRKHLRTPQMAFNEIQSINDKLKKGFNIFLFPEGTSSNGEKVLPFKSTFFQTAIDCRINIIPLCLKYTSENHQSVYWFGKMTFPDHLFRLCLQNRIKVELTQLPEIIGQNFLSRHALKEHAFENIGCCYEQN